MDYFLLCNISYLFAYFIAFIISVLVLPFFVLFLFLMYLFIYFYFLFLYRDDLQALLLGMNAAALALLSIDPEMGI